MGSFKLGGMTLKSIFKKPETIQYPAQQKEAAPGLKGHIALDIDNCILCGICMKRCPCSAIEVSKADRTWVINRFRCVQCGHCVRSCPKQCLVMEPTYASVTTTMQTESFEVPEQEKAE